MMITGNGKRITTDKVTGKMMVVDKLVDLEEAKRFLRKVGLTVDEGVIRKVVRALPHILQKERGFSLYRFYHGAGEQTPMLAKGTADKIKRLYIAGELKPYSDYLTSGGQPEIDAERGNSEHTSNRPPWTPLQEEVYRGPMRQTLPQEPSVVDGAVIRDIVRAVIKELRQSQGNRL